MISDFSLLLIVKLLLLLVFASSLLYLSSSLLKAIDGEMRRNKEMSNIAKEILKENTNFDNSQKKSFHILGETNNIFAVCI